MNKDLMSLSELAVEINQLDKQAIIYAAKCGHKLLEAKARYAHGEFNDWIENHCQLTPMQANKYMQTAIRMPELLQEMINQ
jgi:hypothetical protein